LDKKQESYEDLKFGKGWAPLRRRRKKGLCARREKSAAFIGKDEL